MFSNRRLLKQSSLLYFPKLLSWFGGYLAFSLLFRSRGAAEYGDLVVLTSFWGIPAMIAGDLIGSSAQRLLAEAHTAGPARLNKVFQSIWTMHALALVGVGILAALLMPLINEYIFQSAALTKHMGLGLVLFVGTSSIGFFRYVLRGMQLFQQTLAMDLMESVSRNFLWIACCLGLFPALGLAGGSATAAISAAVLIYVLLYWRGARITGAKPDAHDRGEVAHQAKAFSLIFMCNYAINCVPAIVLNRFHGAEAAGLYAALFKIVDFANGPIVAIAYILAPVATGAKIKGEQEVSDLLTRSFKISILFLPVIGCMAICRTEIVNLFGLSKYADAPAVLLAFCVFMFFANISAIFGSFADFLGYAGARSRIMAVFAVIYVVTVTMLAMDGDVLVVAWGTTIAYSLMVISYLGLIVYHHSGDFIRDNLSLLAKVVVCLSVSSLVACAGVSAPTVIGFKENILSLVLRSLCFGLISAVLGAAVLLRREGGRFRMR